MLLKSTAGQASSGTRLAGHLAGCLGQAECAPQKLKPLSTLRERLNHATNSRTPSASATFGR